MTKVLYVVDNLNVGGAETSLLEIISRFRRTQASVCQLFPGEALVPAFERAGIPVLSVGVRDKHLGPKTWLGLRQRLLEEQPDLVHLMGFFSGLVGRPVGRSVGIPLVDSFTNETYSPAHYGNVPPGSRWKLRTAQFLEWVTLHWVKHVVAISDTVKRQNAARLGVPLQKVSIIYRGREPTRFLEVDENEVEALRKDLGLRPETPVLLNVARLIQRKGQAELIKAMPLVRDAFPRCRLLIAGEGHGRAELEDLVGRLGLKETVSLLGTRSDVAGLLYMANVFVFPSHYEGHGGALVEAMFAARPIVAADTPVHRETIIHGETGLLVAPQDPQGLAEGIIWMLRHREESARMGLQARAVALERFHIDRISAEHEALYERVLGEWKASR